MSTQLDPSVNDANYAEQTYREVVSRLADGGNDPSVAELQAALEGVSASHEQLLADVAQKRTERIELEHLREEHRAEAEQEYTELVLAAAAGYEIDTLSGEAIISASRRTLEDFTRDLKQLTDLENQRYFTEMTWQTKVDELRHRSGRVY